MRCHPRGRARFVGRGRAPRAVVSPAAWGWRAEQGRPEAAEAREHTCSWEAGGLSRAGPSGRPRPTLRPARLLGPADCLPPATCPCRPLSFTSRMPMWALVEQTRMPAGPPRRYRSGGPRVRSLAGAGAADGSASLYPDHPPASRRQKAQRPGAGKPRMLVARSSGSLVALPFRFHQELSDMLPPLPGVSPPNSGANSGLPVSCSRCSPLDTEPLPCPDRLVTTSHSGKRSVFE